MRLTRGASYLLIAAVTIVGLNILSAQGTGGGNTGGGGGSTGGAGGAGGTTPPGGGTTRPPVVQPQPQDRQQQQFPEFVRPIFLSGKVVVDDGMPPPEPATMELVCNGTPRPQGYTDSKGRFSFEVGRNQNLFADASVSNNDTFGSDSMGSFGSSRGTRSVGPTGGRQITERDLMGCDLRAALPGYISTMISLSGRRIMDNPEIGTILLKRIAGVEGNTFSMTTANAPKDASKAYQKGMDQARKKKLPDAETNLVKAVTIYPKYAIAWNDLAAVQIQQGKVDEAKGSLEKAVEADPKFINPHLQLMAIAGKAANWDDTLKYSDAVLKLNPVNYPQAWFYNSVANLNKGNVEAAEKSALEANKLDPNHRIPKISHLLGVIMSQKREYNSALANFKAYLAASPNAPDADQVRQQVSELEKIAALPVEPPKQ